MNNSEIINILVKKLPKNNESFNQLLEQNCKIETLEKTKHLFHFNLRLEKYILSQRVVSLGTSSLPVAKQKR